MINKKETPSKFKLLFDNHSNSYSNLAAEKWALNHPRWRIDENFEFEDELKIVTFWYKGFVKLKSILNNQIYIMAPSCFKQLILTTSYLKIGSDGHINFVGKFSFKKIGKKVYLYAVDAVK